MTMTSSRPYLIRALYDWIVDNKCTPYVLVNALADGVLVPQDYVNPDGQVVLNISPSAVVDFAMNDNCLSFKARFGGVPTDIYVPCRAVMGIYAKENQQGMIFEPEPDPDPGPENPPPSDESGSKKASSPNRPSLKVVK
ncbi:MAG: ClpXP protease specificity-enhancing factor [Pseudomonadota bacterium]